MTSQSVTCQQTFTSDSVLCDIDNCTMKKIIWAVLICKRAKLMSNILNWLVNGVMS